MLKVREYRENKGLTQSELADASGLSLRTIQRVEAGETVPKGHTLTVLSKLMGVEPSELIGINNRNDQLSDELTDQLKLINISALTFILIPFGNIVFPFILWRKYKTNPLVNKNGRFILNFQIIWTLLVSVLLSVSPFVQNYFQLTTPLILIVLLGSYCTNIGMIFRLGTIISRGNLDQLKVTYQLL
ncbi:XRE family transcriptional regulator [Marivirga lumbricoides]|uniref:XRE family transcriptional regulator n=1 Tax=Marivirga lumbricoides TaxID=1046115 RepID=A0A2T4DP95_9BACT|nr:XRE family transcriptional regulator [Marivirga lumbricoides]